MLTKVTSPAQGTTPRAVREIVRSVVSYIVMGAIQAVTRRVILTAVTRRASFVVSRTTQTAMRPATIPVAPSVIREAAPTAVVQIAVLIARSVALPVAR